MVTSTAARGQARSRFQGTSADDPILTSKVTAPGVPSWAVQRPRIDKLIARGARRPLTVVTGPPGAGKTMALALWADACPGAVAWVTLDDYDNRPRVFWSYVITALRRAGIAVPKALSATAPGRAVDHRFLLQFASAMAAQDPPVTLVLDDLHLLTEPKVLDGLAYVLRNAGRGLRLVAASRMDPLLPLHRYRLSGQLTEIRANDLIFSMLEARLLLAQHGITLSAESLERLRRRAEGWAAGLRLAAISMAGHPDPDQFIKEFAAEDSAVTGYLVQEVLNAQPVRVRDFLLRTSILDRVSADIASELADDETAPDVLPALARANAFVLPVGHGWYRYHSLLAAVLRLKLRRDCPDRLPDLHRRAASWYRRNGSLAEAVRHAGNADDWQFAARTAVDELVVGQLIEPRGSEQLADGFRRMPHELKWTAPQPLLVAAAIELSQGQDDSCGASLDAAECMLDRLPADAEIPSRLAAGMVRLALSRRTGDLDAAAAAAATAETLLEAVPEDLLARHPEIYAQVLSGRGAVEFWSGHFDAATATLEVGVAAARASDSAHKRADCLGHLALIEALRGRLNHAAELAADAAGTPENDDEDGPLAPVCSAAEVALACVHTEHNELSVARGRLKQADEALRARPDKLVSAAACLVAARHSLAGGRAAVAAEIVGRARHGWSPPSWLGHRLRLLESSACAAVSDTDSAVDMAASAGPASCLDAAAALAHAWLAAGDPQAARHALASVSAGAEVADWVRMEGRLVDAQLSYGTGDNERGRQSLEHALRLAEPERHRLPFALQRKWILPVLRRDPELADAYRHLLAPDLVSAANGTALRPGAGQAAPLIVERLSEREREVLGHVSAMLSTAEVATEMYISVNTVKTHLKSIYRKLAATHRGEAVRRARQLELL
jgi:LuxR family transcriptional regulator, maltose regulon positive regulatory protein